MERASRFDRAEQLIVENKNFLCSIVSYFAILIIFLNLSSINSPVLGTIASLSFFLINGVFLGRSLFSESALFVRLMLGSLLLTLLLGTAAWFMTLTNNLDNAKITVVLLAVATLCSILNSRSKKQIQRNDTLVTSSPAEGKVDPQKKEISNPKTPRLHILRLVYLFMVVLSFYLLFVSRADEVHTVWEFMHPAFIPVFFATTFVLFIVIVSEEKVSYKLLLITVHSILSHTFFVFIFPASGDVGGQQTVLGTARLLYDNTVVQDPAWSYYPNPLVGLSHWFMRGFHISFSVVFARMFSVDVLWSHLLFIPIAWSAFVPLAVFMVTSMLSQRENVSVLASLLFSVFPSSIIWGTLSAPNSLGFLTFFWALYFTLKHLSSEQDKTIVLAFLFSALSFASHFFTGTMAFSLLLLAVAFRRYEKEKDKDLRSARTLLFSSFAFCSSLLPLSLPFVRLFTGMHPYFGLDKLNELPWIEKVSIILFGEYINFEVGALLVFGAGQLVGLIGMIYYLRKGTRSEGGRIRSLYIGFLFLSFLMFLIDYRILKAFIVNPPFTEERLWLLADFVSVPFLAIAISNVTAYMPKIRRQSLTVPFLKVSFRGTLVYTLLFVALSGWITASAYYAYPHYGPLQTTSYEIAAVKYIDETATGNYIVICDQGFTFAGEIFLGVYNPRAFYFSHLDARGVRLFMNMTMNPSPSLMTGALKYNNATRVYFVIEKPRLGENRFNQIVSQAKQNGLLTDKIFYYQGEEKLRIFQMP